MKKIILILFTLILILSVNVLAVDIDIGMPAIDRTGAFGHNTLSVTIINKGSPANASGMITQVEIWCTNAYPELNDGNLGNVRVATFYETDTNVLTVRDWEALADVPHSQKVVRSVSLNVEQGDYIGIRFFPGSMERDTEGDGMWYLFEDAIPCTDKTFTLSPTSVISLYGIGAAVGWPHKWNTQTISKWNTQEFTKWNGLE